MKNKVPLRKCVITNEQLPKKDMFRIVKTKDGEVLYDPTGKANGRGLYLKKDILVIKQAMNNKKLNHLLGVEINSELYEQLKSEL